jgi:cyclopropane fatty-acyl-phospholipid synthase-like methyltransferase
MNARFALLVVCFYTSSSFADHHEKPHHSGHAAHRFEDAELWAKRFEDPARDAWQKPNEVLKALALTPDMKVADLGSATGYFTVRLAKALPKGKVYAVDVETTLNDYLKKRLKKEGIQNATVVLGDAKESKLPEAVDMVLVVDTYHHVPDREVYFKKLNEKLRPGGRVVIIDFKKGVAMGPPDAEKLDAAHVIKELGNVGLKLRKEHAILPNQYFLEFERS